MKRNLALMLVGFAAYAFALVFSQKLLQAGPHGDAVRILLSLAPMLPAVFICGVIIRTIRHLDEMQRKLQVEALAFAFAGTALLTFGYGFLEGAGLPTLSMFVVWPLMAALWVIGTVIGRIRYG